VRSDQISQAAGRYRAGLEPELVADARDDLVDLPCEAVDEARLERVAGRLPDHGRRSREINRVEPRSSREESVHRNLDARCEHAAHELTVLREHIEVGRSPEVDDDAWSAVPLTRADGVGNPVGCDLTRIVVANRQARPCSGTDDEHRCRSPPRGEVLEGMDKRRHRRGEADSLDDLDIDQRGEEGGELVAGPVGLGGDPPSVPQLAVLEQPKHRLGIADVDR
jgi:hypothetical protein